jgi:hypothetical protein
MPAMQAVKIAKEDLGRGTLRCLGGWAMLSFSTQRDAVDALSACVVICHRLLLACLKHGLSSLAW